MTNWCARYVGSQMGLVFELEREVENAKMRLLHGEEAAANKIGVGEGSKGGPKGVPGVAKAGDGDDVGNLGDGGDIGDDAVSALLADFGGDMEALAALCES